MNTKKFMCREAKNGSLNDSSLSFSDHHCQNFGSKHLWNMGVCFQLPLHFNSQCLDLFSWLEDGPNPSHSPASCFQSLHSAFHVADRNPGFPPHVNQIGHLPIFPQFSSSWSAEFSSYQPSEATLSINFMKQSDIDSQSCNTSQSFVKFPSCGHQNSRVSENCSSIQSRNPQASELLPFPKSDDAMLDGRHLDQVETIHNSSAIVNPFNPSITQPNSPAMPEKQRPKPSVGLSSNFSSGVAVSNKTRIRWTQDLHERFVESVNCLGGAEKATPKGILKLMDHDGLTIFQVKSHLQKYRIAKYIPDSAEGKFERRTSCSDIPKLSLKTGMRIKEALHLQLDVQRRLDEQLEVQRKLQMQIEEQGKRLQKMFEHQLRTKRNLLETQNLYTTG